MYTELGEYMGLSGRFFYTSCEVATDPSRPLFNEVGLKRWRTLRERPQPYVN